jgi:hypothetical protein
MTGGNVVKFPYEAARRIHSRKLRRSKNVTPEERAAKASAEATGQIRTPVLQLPIRPECASIAGVLSLQQFEKLPKEEKRRVAAEVERRISARMAGASADISLKKQRDARYEAWGKAGAKASFWKALDDLQHALYVAQREKMPEALRYDPVELGSASWHATHHAYRDATDRQLLTPAPNMGCVRWKQGQKFSRLSRDRIERAIADDLAWLKRYPASERRVRRPPE